MHHNPPIRVAAVVLINDDGHVSLVRKHHTLVFIFPGGKPEPGEDRVATATREVHEELGVALEAEKLLHLGDFTTLAANETQTQLISQVYQARLPVGASGTAQAEIAQLIWVDPDNVALPADTRLAPLSAMILEGLDTSAQNAP